MTEENNGAEEFFEQLPDIHRQLSDSVERELGRINEKYDNRKKVREDIDSGVLSRDAVEDRMEEHEQAIASMPDVLSILRYVNGHVRALVRFYESGDAAVHDRISLEDAIWDYIIEQNVLKDFSEGGDELVIKRMRDRTRIMDEAIAAGQPSDKVAVAQITRAAGLRQALTGRMRESRDHIFESVVMHNELPKRPDQCKDWVELVWIVNTFVDADKIYSMGVKQEDKATKLRQFQGRDVLDYVKYVPIGQMSIDFLPSREQAVGKKNADVDFVLGVREKMEEFLSK